MSNVGTKERPLRVAIIGSGPSGFYAADALLKSDINVTIDMFDRLPTPYGLVRGGVAPDHHKIKKVIKLYEKTAAEEKVSFWGNVNIGKDISIDELRDHFDAVIFSCGSQTDRKLGIPGEDLSGSYTATEFVGWYNGHPDYRGREFDLSHEDAFVIGQGNVAMDVCRILAKTVDELKGTDIAKHALDVLAASKVKKIHMVGRRGAVQAKFFDKELLEIGNLADCDVTFNNPGDFDLNPECRAELEDPKNTTTQRNWKILQEFLSRPPSKKSKKLIIHFFQSPVELLGEGTLEKILLEKNKLVGEPGAQKARGTGEKQECPCGLLFRSVGYRGISIPGIPFDEKKGIFPNKDGRIIDGENVLSGLYVSGWIKRGPSGVIGTNKPDSIATVNSIISDVPGFAGCAKPGSAEIEKLLKQKNVRFVTFEGWKKIDAEEIKRGKEAGKPREKFTTVEEMLAVLD